MIETKTTTRARPHSTQCYFSEQGIRVIDFKDLDTLRKFLNPHGRIIARRRTGVCAKHQRELARAIKRAREMALIPYIIK